MRAIAVIPTYNERENLPELIRKLHEHAPALDVLIVDDNSPDGTGALADALAVSDPDRISVLHRQRKEGLGRAYVAGFREAILRGYDAIVQMDADLSHDPGYVPRLLERIEHCDLVLGSRYVRGINVVNWDFKRLVLSKLASKYVQFVTRMPYTDPTGGFKCWRRATLQTIGVEQVFATGYLFQVETTYKSFRRRFRIEEVPIVFYERNLGRSKMHWRIIAEAVWGVVRLRVTDGFAPRPAAAPAAAPASEPRV